MWVDGSFPGSIDCRERIATRVWVDDRREPQEPRADDSPRARGSTPLPRRRNACRLPSGQRLSRSLTAVRADPAIRDTRGKASSRTRLFQRCWWISEWRFGLVRWLPETLRRLMARTKGWSSLLRSGFSENWHVSTPIARPTRRRSESRAKRFRRPRWKSTTASGSSALLLVTARANTWFTATRRCDFRIRRAGRVTPRWRRCRRRGVRELRG